MDNNFAYILFATLIGFVRFWVLGRDMFYREFITMKERRRMFWGCIVFGTLFFGGVVILFDF